MEPLTTGMKVYLMPVGDNYRRGDKEPRESVVQKVGRKYIYVIPEGHIRAVKFDIEDHREVTIYSPDWELYPSEQAILDERERQEIESVLRQAFGSYGRFNGYTIDQLRRIKAIVDELEV